jgi:hypothetical protein
MCTNAFGALVDKGFFIFGDSYEKIYVIKD